MSLTNPSSLKCSSLSSCGIFPLFKSPIGRQIPIYLIAAVTPKMGIGKDNKLPWGRIPKDMNFFLVKTTKTKNEKLINVVIMGRKTWDSIPNKFKPLCNRINIIISNTLNSQDVPEGVWITKSLDEAIEIATNKLSSKVELIFVIGGASIYRAALSRNYAEKLYMTRIGCNFDCDTFIPDINENNYKITYISSSHTCNNIPFDFATYTRIDCISSSSRCTFSVEPPNNLEYDNEDFIENEDDGKENKDIQNDVKEGNHEKKEKILCCPFVIDRYHEEFQYLDLIADLIINGFKQQDRTGVGVLSKFGHHMRFNLRKTFPLLTTKRVFWRGIVEELMWFIRGDTNANNLSNKGVKIWEKNGSRKFLDSCGLSHREVGDLGPVYGFQWRHFGAEYVDMHTDYTNKGVDQLKICIEKIKKNPNDRTIIMSAWNPSDLSKMALPPCHVLCQFYVASGELSCLLYQRSCDLGLGVPFNIASYALLTRIIGQICDLKPGDLVYSMGNAHIYLNHVEPLKEQLRRTPVPFPILHIKSSLTDIDNIKYEDFELFGYNPHKKIDMEMAV